MNEPQTAIEASEEARPGDSAAGMSFETDCIDLLCRQENTLSLLSEAYSKQRLLDALDLAKRMVVEFLDFAEAHFEGEEVHDVAERLHAVYQETKEHEKQLCQQTFKSLKKLVGINVLSEEEIREAHDTLRSEYAQLYSQFFALCVSRFPEGSPTTAEFQQSVDTFVKELDRKW